MYRFLRGFSLALLMTMLCQVFTIVPVKAAELCGDLNNDGVVDSADYTLMRRNLLGSAVLGFSSNADTYKDGIFDSADYMVLRKYLLEQIKTLPFIPESTPTPTPQITATPTEKPTGDWVSFTPQAENVALRYVIEGKDETIDGKYVFKMYKYIQVSITFFTGGYRIADEGKLTYSIADSQGNYTTKGVKIEQYVGPNPVTQALVTKQINYPIGDEMRDKNHFNFSVNDQNISEFYFTKNSIISPTPVPFNATLNKDFVNGNTQFAANLMHEFNKYDANKNIFFSPLSISMALSMAYQGAETTTKDAIAKTLNYTGMSTNDINQSYVDHLKYFKSLYPQVELDIGNSIWVRDGFKIKDSFISKNKEVFGAECSNLDFNKKDAPDIMNKWISDATKGKIDNMINPPIPQELVMYLMNAIYFKGSWTDKFDESQTMDANFTNINNEKKPVKMMNKTDSYKYAENTGNRAIEIPYGSGNISMYCILPETDNINDFIAKFDNSKWADIKSSLKQKSNIILKLPRFKIEYKPEKLTDSLKTLGMKEAFERNADFSGIAPNIWIDNVIHKAVIDVNEKGTEAAAVTIIGYSGISMPNSFVADKPFMFVIADNKTGAILFMGKVVDL